MSTSRSAKTVSREADLVRLAAEGHTDKEIARRLGISEDTVETYWRRIRARYGAASRTEAVARAIAEGYDLEIAKRKKVEDDLRNLTSELEARVARRTAELKVANERLRTLQAVVEGTGAVVWWGDGEPPWNVGYISENVSQWGYTVEEIRSRRVTLAMIIHPDDAEQFNSDVEQCLASPYQLFDREYRLRTKDGDYRLIRERVVYLPEDHDGHNRIQGVQVDITGTKEHEAGQPAFLVTDRLYPITPMPE